MFLSTKYGMAGLAMDTGVAFVTADNVDAIAPLAAQIRYLLYKPAFWYLYLFNMAEEL